jgi:hypothetical protein
MAFRRQGPLVVVVHDNQTPSAEEWTRYLALARELDVELKGRLELAGAVIFTDGGGPSSSQRVDFNKIVLGRTVVSAIVSESLAVRGIVGALSLFNSKGLKVFVPSEWKVAMDFARIPAERHLEFLQIAVSLGREVGDPKVLRKIGL